MAVIVLCFFLVVQWVGLWSEIVAFLCYTHLLLESVTVKTLTFGSSKFWQFLCLDFFILQVSYGKVRVKFKDFSSTSQD